MARITLPEDSPMALRARLAALACLAACAATTTPTFAQKVMTPGGWEMATSITRELEGQPTEQMGRHTIKMCLTPEFLASDPYFNPNLDDQRMAAQQIQCTSDKLVREGDSASWTMACTMKDGTSLTAHVRNSATAETVRLNTVQDIERPGGNKGRVTMGGEGRHIGECTEEMSKPTPPVRSKAKQ